MFDPELAIERAIEYYRRKGYTEDWISQRLFSIRVRKNLTFEWRERGVKTNSEYAILTNDIYRAWSDMARTRSWRQDGTGCRPGRRSLASCCTRIPAPPFAC